MTHEQKLLCYLYGVDSIQRRQLVIALPDIPYQSLTLAVRNAIKHGYVEVFRKDESNYLRISPDGIKYIRTTAKDSLDSEKRATMKRRFKGEQGRRLNRVETTSCMCRAAGIKLAKEEGIQLTNILNANTKDYERFMENYFYNKGLLFLSDELSATIKATNTVGEEYTTGMSRLVGAIINSKGIYYLYCTLDKLMKWIISYEKRRVSAITALLQNSNAATESQDFQTACAIQPKSIIIGKTCAMIPKIITGDKYGKNIKRAGETTITNKLMTLTNLEEVYKHNYFVPTDTLGVELLSRTVTLTRDDLNQMIEMWLSEMTDKHTTIEAREYGSTLTIEQLEQQDENLPERLRRVWTSYVAVRDSAEADNYMKGLMRKKVLSLLAEKHVTVYRVCKDTGINRGRLYRWLNKENMSAISCRGVDKVLRYLDKLPENA